MRQRVFIVSILFLMIISSISAAFSSPFSDVPSDHWAFEAIDSLYSKGIIEGYEDNKFKGNQVVSRYHLAMVTAKMLANIEQTHRKITKADLKVIERLTIEFEEELNLMNIRVKSLEKDLNDVQENVSSVKKEIRNLQKFIQNGGNDKVKLSGDITVRNYNYNQKKVRKENRTETMFRIQLDSVVNEKVSIHTRWNLIEHNNDRQAPFATNQWNGGNKNTGNIEIANLQLKNTFKSNETIKVGRDWYTHGHGIVIHDNMDAISISKSNSKVDLALNCYFDRNNSINQKDYLNIWNINADYKLKNHKLYLGLYLNSRDNANSTPITKVKLNKNKKDLRIEFGSSGKFTNKRTDYLNYDLAGVYNKLDTFIKYPAPNNKEVDMKGWLGYFALKHNRPKNLNFKLAYTYADEESYASIKRTDYNSYCIREETPFDDLSLLISNGFINNIKNIKVQIGYTLRNADRHSFRFAYDKIKEKNSYNFKTDTNLFTAEYQYKVSNNSRIRFIYQNAKDDEGHFTAKGSREKLLLTEIYSRF